MQVYPSSGGENAQDKNYPPGTQPPGPVLSTASTAVVPGQPYRQGPGYYGPQSYSQFQMNPNFRVVGVGGTSNPCGCCNCTLQAGTTAVAIYGIVIGVISTLIGILFIAITEYFISEAQKSSISAKDLDLVKWMVRGCGIIILAMSLTDLTMNLILYCGASNKSRRHVTAWLCYSVFCMVVAVGVTAMSVQSETYAGILWPVKFLPQLYCMWVVYAFRQELLSVEFGIQPPQGILLQSNTQMTYGQQPMYNPMTGNTQWDPQGQHMPYDNGPQQYSQNP